MGWIPECLLTGYGHLGILPLCVFIVPLVCLRAEWLCCLLVGCCRCCCTVAVQSPVIQVYIERLHPITQAQAP